MSQLVILITCCSTHLIAIALCCAVTGLVQILTYESAFIGVSWSNLGEVENNFATATALAFLIFDSGLYLFLAW